MHVHRRTDAHASAHVALFGWALEGWSLSLAVSYVFHDPSLCLAPTLYQLLSLLISRSLYVYIYVYIYIRSHFGSSGAPQTVRGILSFACARAGVLVKMAWLPDRIWYLQQKGKGKGLRGGGGWGTLLAKPCPIA